jgi:hypothetical protein
VTRTGSESAIRSRKRFDFLFSPDSLLTSSAIVSWWLITSDSREFIGFFAFCRVAKDCVSG